MLGLLVPSMANPMYGYIAREIETFAQEQFGHRLLLGSTYRDREKESAFFEDLLAHGVRRVIVISSLADERHFESAVERGMVVVSYDRGATPGQRSKVGHVMPDNFEAARLATRHLIDKGHRRLAFAIEEVKQELATHPTAAPQKPPACAATRGFSTAAL